jgi:hypothetical protein
MTSKFKGILTQAKARETESDRDKEEATPSPAPASSSDAKKRGRPSGKRSDDDYVQVTAYIQKDTHRDVKIALLKSGSDLDFSELVDNLLAKWLKAHS